MNYKKGDVLDLEEPPVGFTLQSDGPLGPFRIHHHYDGWKIEGKRSGVKVCWRRVIAQWGPGAGQKLTVVTLP